MPWVSEDFAVGKRYRKIAPEGDRWDAVEHCGWFTGGESGSIVEMVVRTVEHGEAPVTASVDSFLEVYERDEGPRAGAVDDAQAALAAIAGGDDAG